MQMIVEACGRTWAIPSEPSVGAILGFGEWVAAREGDILGETKQLIELLPKTPEGEAEARQLVREASNRLRELKEFSLEIDIAKRYLRTEAGLAELMRLRLAEVYPDVTLQQAFAVVVALGKQVLAEQEGPEGNGKAPATLLTGAMS